MRMLRFIWLGVVDGWYAWAEREVCRSSPAAGEIALRRVELADALKKF